VGCCIVWVQKDWCSGEPRVLRSTTQEQELHIQV
jgi:hypothetical protein